MANPVIYVFTAGRDGLTPSAFVPLIVPVNCSAYMLKNSGPDVLYMRSDPADVLTEDSFASGFYEDLSMSGAGFFQQRYIKGQILYYVKCTGPLVGKFWY